MSKSVLVVSNEKEFSDLTIDKILSIVELIVESGKEVHIFKEDLKLYSLLRNNDKVNFINGLNSGADILLFNRINEGAYSSTDSMKSVKTDFSEVYKKSITRNITPDRAKTFDEAEFKTLRESVMHRRLKFSIAQISALYQFIIVFKDNKDVNLLNSIKPEHGDGKFIYVYDCIKNRSEFTVGGFSLSESDFQNCIKEVR